MITEYCDVCDKDTLHTLQFTVRGEVIRCEECATVTAERN